jgi:hypothetical protein
MHGNGLKRISNAILKSENWPALSRLLLTNGKAESKNTKTLSAGTRLTESVFFCLSFVLKYILFFNSN